jgi:uncharacterized protein HemX
MDQQNVESKPADERNIINNGAVSSSEGVETTKKSRIIWFSAIISVFNLVAVILFGVWYVQVISNKDDQIVANKLALEKYADQLQIELSESVLNVGDTVKSQGLELERLIGVVAQIENNERPLEIKSRIDQSMVVWYLRDLLSQINGVPLDTATKRVGLAYLQRLRDALAALDLEPKSQDISEALDQDLISLQNTKTLNRFLIESELEQLIELSSHLESPVDGSPVDANLMTDSSNLNADWSILTNIWQEIKSLIQVRQVAELDTRLDTKYFRREALRLKLFEAIYLIKAGDTARITVSLEEIRVYIGMNFDPQGPKTQAALASIENLKGMTDVTLHDLSSTLILIEDYFININVDKTLD